MYSRKRESRNNNNLNFEQIKFPVHARLEIGTSTWKRFLNIGRVGSDCLETHYAGNDRTFYYVPLWMTTFLPSPLLVQRPLNRFDHAPRNFSGELTLLLWFVPLQQSHHPHAREGDSLITVVRSPYQSLGYAQASSSTWNNFWITSCWRGRIMSLLVMKMEGLFRWCVRLFPRVEKQEISHDFERNNDGWIYFFF